MMFKTFGATLDNQSSLARKLEVRKRCGGDGFVRVSDDSIWILVMIHPPRNKKPRDKKPGSERDAARCFPELMK